MQSLYSELMGLYPPGQGPQLTEAQVKAVTVGPAVPPFKVRDARSINEMLRSDALPDRFEPIPVMVYSNYDINDDVSALGCPVIEATEELRTANETVWEPYNWMMENVREPIKEMFNVTDEDIDSMNFHEQEHLTDSAVAVNFDGHIAHEEYFSDDQWRVDHQFQRIYLSVRETEDSRALEISRILRKPLREMKQKVNDLLNGKKPKDLKLMIYSAHDDQLINMLDFLKVKFPFVPYSGSVTFELKYSVSCLNSKKASEDCFGVSVRHNGNPIMFEGCTGDNFMLEGCKWPEFESFMKQVWYKGPEAPDLDAACAAKPAPNQ